MSEQIDDTPTTRTRRNKIGAMRAAPTRGSPEATREVAGPSRRGRKPKQVANTASDALPKRRGRPPLEAGPQPKRSLAHARLIERIDALVGEHDVKRIGKLLDAVQGLR